MAFESELERIVARYLSVSYEERSFATRLCSIMLVSGEDDGGREK